jgi:ABC-type Fe3+/spermidine/putrescine transport system ATPase subunit
MTSGPILELRRVSKRFGAQAAVNEVSLEVPRGAFFSLLGPSGCGKTTTLRLIAGFETPDQGEIRLNGERIDTLPPYRRNVNTVFQNYALFPHLSVRRNVEFGLKRTGAQEAAERVRTVIEQVRLQGKESRMPAELSGGERQRVALARSLVLKPDVLLLDEPLSALDPQLRKQVRAELKQLQRNVGVTFVFVTHDQEEALSLSDWIAVMNGGAIEQVAAPEEVYRRPRTRFVASFLGEMNWLDGVGLRPEATRIARERPQNGCLARKAVVTGAVFLGPVVQVEAKVEGGGTVIVQTAQNGAAFQPGEEVHVWWQQADELRLPE